MKYVFTFRLQPWIDPEELCRYWIGTHLPNVRRTAGLRKFVINWAIGAPSDNPGLFGLAELRFDDIESATQALQAPRQTHSDQFDTYVTDMTRDFMEEREVEL